MPLYVVTLNPEYDSLLLGLAVADGAALRLSAGAYAVHNRDSSAALHSTLTIEAPENTSITVVPVDPAGAWETTYGEHEAWVEGHRPQP